MENQTGGCAARNAFVVIVVVVGVVVAAVVQIAFENGHNFDICRCGGVCACVCVCVSAYVSMCIMFGLQQIRI